MPRLRETPAGPRTWRGTAPVALALGVGALGSVVSLPAAAHPGLHHDWEAATEAMQENPTAPEPRLERARVARTQGNWLLAYHEGRWAAALAPRDARPYRAQGLAAATLGMPAALALLDRYFELGGAAFDARRARAELEWQAGLRDEAVRDLDLAIEGRPDVAAGLQRARWLEALGQPEAAAHGLAALLTRLGDAELLRRELVELELRRGRPASALPWAEDALRKHPKNVSWLLSQARILTDLGRPAEARSSLERALEAVEYAISRRPNALRLAQRAEVRIALGDRSGARSDLKAALLESPSYPKARALAAVLNLPSPRLENAP